MRALKSIGALQALLLCFTCLAGSPQERGLDLIGTWLILPPSPPGVIVHQFVTFRRGGGKLVGAVESIGAGKESSRAPISDVRVAGDAVSFRVTDSKTGRPLALWKGHFAGAGELQMTMYFFEDNNTKPAHTRIFRRISATDVAELKAKLPKNLIFDKVPLPTLRELPSNGLAHAPPMGWSSWNHFLETIDDRTVREIADAMVSSGLRDAGYTLLAIDDGWQGHRDSGGVLHPNSKFPDMKALVNYVHSKGLMFGIYTSPGPVSCAGYVGSHGYEAQDAQMFASWGVDVVKNDVCSAAQIYKEKKELRALHQKMAEALRATGRPIMYNVHDAINLFPDARESWGRKVGANFWRTGGDLIIGERWKSVSERFERHGNPEDAGPGGWNDADILVIGLGGVTPEDRPLTYEESRTHMTLWSILASPLILGNDVRTMSAEDKSIVMNKEVIAVNQDPLGKQGRRIVKEGPSEVWAKPMADGSMAVAMFNRGAINSRISIKWSDLKRVSAQKVRDLWNHADLGEYEHGYSMQVPAHGSVLLRIESSTKHSPGVR